MIFNDHFRRKRYVIVFDFFICIVYSLLDISLDTLCFVVQCFTARRKMLTSLKITLF